MNLQPDPDSPWVTALQQGQPQLASEDTAAILTLFRALPVPVAIARVADSQLLYTNRYFESVFGRPEPGTAVLRLSQCFEPAAWQVLVQALVQYRFLLNYELRLCRRDRQQLWGLVSLQLLTLEAESVILGVFHDITYPKQIERALQASQQTLATLTQHLPGALYRCRLEADQACEFISDGSERLTGYPSRAFLEGTCSLRALIAPEDRERVEASIQRAIAQNRPYALEYRLLTASQELRWVWEQGSVIEYPGTIPLYLEGFITDITERKRAEEELSLLQALTRAIAEAPDFNQAIALVLHRVCDHTDWLCGEAWIPDPASQQLTLSPAWYSRVEHSRPEALSLSDFRQQSEHYQFARPESLPGRVWRERQPCWLPDVTQDPDFCRADLAQACGLHASCGVPIMAGAEVVAVLVFFQATAQLWEHRSVELISAIATQLGGIVQRKRAEAARQESERRLRSLLDATPGLFFTASPGPNWPMTYLSQGCQALTGYPSETFTQDRGVYDRLIHPEDRERVLAAIDLGVVGRQPYVVEYRLRHRDGGERWVWEKGHGVYADDGTVLGLEGFIADITDRKQSEDAVRAYAGELQALFAAMTDLILVLDADGRYCKIAPTSPDLLYQSRELLLGKTVTEIFPPDTAALFLQAIHQALDTRRPLQVEYALEIQGRPTWFSATVSPTPENTVVWVARDITENRQAQAALEAAEAKYRSIFENAVEGIFQTTADGRYLSANPALARIYGYDSPEELMTSLTNIPQQLYVDPQQRADFVRQVQEQGLVRGFEAQIYRRDGSRIWISESARAVRDRQGQLLYYEGMVEDITAQKQAEAQLQQRAFYDPLTGLPNRALFQTRLAEAIARTQGDPSASSKQFAVLFLDLDRFKVVNDSLGHWVGDQLLVAIARRLECCLREGDLVARLGGDEFTILLYNTQDLSDAIAVADRINAALKAPFTLEGYQVFTGASIGIVLSSGDRPPDDTTALLDSEAAPVTRLAYQQPEDLLRDADTALYRAKALGKGRYELFDPTMHHRAVAQLQGETELRQAVDRQEFVLYYQPIIDLAATHLSGFEVLLRWQHPQRGLLQPPDFMALAEETGLLIPLGYWLLTAACQQLQAWQARYGDAAPGVLEINCSRRQFFHPELLAQLEAACEQHGLPGQNLRLAIPESLWSEDGDLVRSRLQELRARQIQVGVDDFGAGYSRLHYLNEAPPDTLKIDRSFIHDLAGDISQAEIAQIAILLAQRRGLTAIAAGVETAAQLAAVRELGCHFAQGHLFAAPLPAEEAEVWLRPGNPGLDGFWDL